MQNSTLLKVVLSVAVAVGGVVFFVKSTLGNTEEYKMVDELMAGDLAHYEGRDLKVHGWVVPGTIKKKIVDQQTIHTFVIQKAGKRIRVFTKAPPPDTFNDTSEVVATGRLVPSAEVKQLATQRGATLDADAKYVVEARDLSAKCPSKYDGAMANKKLDAKLD